LGEVVAVAEGTVNLSEHPNLALIRAFYAARATHDRSAIRRILHPDIAWHDPYPPPHGGDLKGIESVLADIFDRAGALTGGSTRLELRDAVATREYVAAVVDWRSTLAGRTMTGTELAVYRVVTGRVVEAWFYPDEQAAAARFFGGSP